MANNTNINKVVYGTSTLIDLTEDTITPETLAAGITAHDASGKKIVGIANMNNGYNEIVFTSTNDTNYTWTDNNIIFNRTNLNYIPIYIRNDETEETIAAAFKISTSTITYAADEKFSGTLYVLKKDN